MSWVEHLPRGVLNQWLAWDKVEPMGEEWMQTASIVQSINLPMFARAGKELPDVETFMPDRYRRPKKRLSDQLFKPPSSQSLFGKVKSMFGAK